jgi:RNA polymerase sigma-54 factor
MLKQGLQQKLSQKLSYYQIQFIKLLEIPTTELVQRINKELESNPILESSENSEDVKYKEQEQKQKDKELDNEYTPNYKLQAKNRSKNDKIYEMPVINEISLIEHLENQIANKFLTEQQKLIVPYIIGNIDENGYLRRGIESITDDIAFALNKEITDEEVEECLFIVQDLDPVGIGARNLQECLSLQLHKKKQSTINELAINVIDKQFEIFTKKNYVKITKSLKITNDELKEVINHILKLNPKPGISFDHGKNNRFSEVVTPDFILEENEGQLYLSLNRDNTPELNINSEYIQSLKENIEQEKDAIRKEASNYIKQKTDSAKWFIDAIQERQTTLLYTMQKIIDFQKRFFLTGDEANLVPMKLKDIAEITGFDISTISRIINSKFIQTSFGIFRIKQFFSESLETTEGEEVSTKEIKIALKEIIEAENKHKPYTDDRLAIELKNKGYKISRRTIAKYRDQLNIPVARMRKEI